MEAPIFTEIRYEKPRDPRRQDHAGRGRRRATPRTARCSMRSTGRSTWRCMTTDYVRVVILAADGPHFFIGTSSLADVSQNWRTRTAP